MRTTLPTVVASRGRRVLAAAALLATVSLTGCNPVLEHRGVVAVNALRHEAGGKHLASHPQLEARARAVAGELARKARLEHSRLGEGITVRYSLLGENIAWGRTLEEAYAALEASHAHRANMLDPRYRYVGIGVAQSLDGRVWVAQLFMAP